MNKVTAQRVLSDEALVLKMVKLMTSDNEEDVMEARGIWHWLYLGGREAYQEKYELDERR